MSDIKFWRLIYQLFKPDEPLTQQELKDFYVRREDSPVDSLVNLLAMEDEAAKFLLSGHRGGGKTTELRRLEQKCLDEYTVVWVDTDAALDKFNIGYAEVVVLIGISIVQQLADIGWKLPQQLEHNLLESLARVTQKSEVRSQKYYPIDESRGLKSGKHFFLSTDESGGLYPVDFWSPIRIR